ncbi:CHAT domain-containing protein [Adonisia turfae]|uniref:Tetratricopeptide repeat protein n=1 Tax=Adonisia turfae CCMR0081 TaxID=2292702 RepID=A0A6M0RH48_9CYAN|nr:tetratricopeptide repeat protein [Adonisia turfae]NEZ55230.1 tetratricopeptide repeat protein [Adonisia turfae CCMR0081]
MIKLFGLSLTLVLSALMTEIGEAAPTTSEPTTLSMDRIDNRQLPVKRSSFWNTGGNLGTVYREHLQETYWLNTTVGTKQEARKTEADQLFNESVRLWQISRWQEALEKLKQALIVYQEIGDRQGESRALTGLGSIADSLGQYSQALDYFEQALMISREINDRASQGFTLNNIGLTYHKLGQYPRALNYYEQALRIMRETGNRFGESTTLNNIGGIYDSLGQDSQALDYYGQALVITREIGNRTSEGSTLNNIGSIYNSLGQYLQALDYYGQALVISREIGNRAGEGSTLDNIGLTYHNLGQYSQALDYHNQALVIRREIDDRAGEGTTLNNIGGIYNSLDQYPQALDYYEQALIITREIGNRAGEGTNLSNIGSVYDSLGQYLRALDYYEQALVINRAIGDRASESTTLSSIGSVYDSLGQYPQALNYFYQALVIRREIGNRAGESVTLNNIGLTHNNLGQYPQALNYFYQALVIRRETGDRTGEGSTINNIGGVYDNLGQYPKALGYYEQALRITREIGDRAVEGATLNNISITYRKLGQYPQALDYYEQALVISREIRDRAGEGLILNNIGLTYHSLGQYPQALSYYEQALAISREMGNRAGEGTILNNIGLTYHSLGQYPQASGYYEQALAISREVGNRAGAGTILNNIGLNYYYLGQYPQALGYYEQALAILREIGDRTGEGLTLNNIGRLLDATKESELAIIFLKQSVNIYENIRDDHQTLTQEQQQSYTDMIAPVYRRLADLLLQENRVLEAQAVLDLLRTQELEDYFQDVRSHDDAPRNVDYWQPEEEILTLYKEVLLAKEDLARLKAKADTEGYDSLTPDELELFDQLSAREGELLDNFTEFLEYPAVKAAIALLRTSTEGQNIELASLRTLQNNIANLPNAVLLYPLIFEDRLELILVPPDAPPIRRPVEVSAKDVNDAILNYRTLLRSPHGSTQQAKAAAQKLYNWLIKDIEEDLALLDNGTSTQTIVYSPDGALRYIPLVALHDGNQWLAERFSVTHITTDSISDFDTPPQTEHAILAAACADCSFSPTVGGEQYTFSDLSFTRTEVNNLAAQIPNTDVLLDVAFSKTDTKRRIELVGYNIIHLATHGAFVSSSPDESFILFGDGNVATLREMRSWPLRDADLVVLSACETGLGGQDLDSGIEVLGLGYQIQRAGAKAAMASLWRVDDGGTQALMNAFYLALSEGLPKAEALRRAQLALIKDDLSVISGESRAAINIVDFDTGEPISLNASSDHPYYWAPFILIGNGL